MISRLWAILVFVGYTSVASAQWQKVYDSPYIGALYEDSTALYAGATIDAPFLVSSTDEGLTWDTVGNRLTSAIYSVTRFHDKLFAGCERGIYILTDTGFVFESTTKAYCFYQDDSQLIASSTSGIARFLYDSLWHSIYIPGDNTFFSVIPVSNGLLVGSDGIGVLKTTNDGKTWDTSNSGIKDMAVWSLLRWQNNIYVGTTSKIYYSSNEGDSWTSIPDIRLSSEMFRLYSIRQNIVALTDSQFFYSSDGQRWIDWSQGLPASRMLKVTVSRNYVFVSTSEGIWRRPLSDLDKADVKNAPMMMNSVSAIPNPFRDEATLRVSLVQQNMLHVVCFNALGEEISSSDYLVNSGINEISLDLKNRPDGVYYCRISGDGFSKVVSVIKK